MNRSELEHIWDDVINSIKNEYEISDLDETRIKNHVDNILFLYRDEYYNDLSTEKGIAEIIVAKNKNGRTGIVNLVFVEGF